MKNHVSLLFVLSVVDNVSTFFTGDQDSMLFGTDQTYLFIEIIHSRLVNFLSKLVFYNIFTVLNDCSCHCKSFGCKFKSAFYMHHSHIESFRYFSIFKGLVKPFGNIANPIFQYIFQCKFNFIHSLLLIWFTVIKEKVAFVEFQQCLQYVGASSHSNQPCRLLRPVGGISESLSNKLCDVRLSLRARATR